MTRFLLDTNAISDIRKPRPNPGMTAWFESADDDVLFVSVLTLGEITQGAAQLRRRDEARAVAIDAWCKEIAARHAGRVLPVDREVASCWGTMAAIRTVAVIDGLLAATAIVHDLTLVTRNERDVAGLGARVLNPFT